MIANPFPLIHVYVLLLEMARFRIKQIGLALSLVTSLLVGHAAAVCMCSHHEPQKAPQADCHSSHTEGPEAASVGAATTFDADCICLAQGVTPSTAAKSINKKFKSKDLATGSAERASDFKLVAVVEHPHPLPGFHKKLSYSNTLETLLPSRAPPRL